MALPQEVSGLRDRLAFYFEDVETPVGRTINVVLTGLILLSCGLFVAETYDLPADWRQWLHWFDDGILVLFAIEYLLRLWAAPKRWAFVLQITSIIDVLILLPFIFSSTNLNFLRIFRWLRILRLIRFIRNQRFFGYVLNDDNLIVIRILFTIFAIIFVYAGLIYQVEHPINAEQFSTFLDAIYYAVSSISTAGFGDITPISQVGRLLSVLMILTGLVLIPGQLGELLRRVLKNNDRQEIICPSCGLSSHEPDAKFCRACGTQLSSELP
jgi:voltage-gated potassium channel